MRLIFRFILLAIVLVGGFLFVRSYRRTTPWGYGTGYYAGRSGADKTDKAVRSRLTEVMENPAKYEGKRVTLTGRVRQTAKYASNRNLYTLAAPDAVKGEKQFIVIDDKPAPQPYYTRTVTGVVKRIPGTTQFYLVDLKSGVQINLPSLVQIKGFLSQKYDETRTVVRDELKR